MKPGSKVQAVALIVRVLLGVWFVQSGGTKLFKTGLDQFTRDIANYKLVHAPFDMVVAYSVPWMELLGGVCLMLGILRKGTLLAMTGLVLVFSAAVGWALAHGLDISCGCGGGDTKVTWWKGLEFLGYLTGFGFLWWTEGKGDHRIASMLVSRD